MKLKVKDKKSFITNFLNSISSLNDSAVLKIEPTKISCLIASNDATLVLNSEYPIEADGSATANIADVKKLIRVLECVETEYVDLNITANYIKHEGENFKFKYHLLENDIIKAPNLNINKITSLKLDTTFTVTENDLGILFKGSSFTTETNKLYLYIENNKVFGELGDKNRHNSDNFQCCLSNQFEGSLITKLIPINFETFRLINCNKCGVLNFGINQQYGVIKITLNKGESKLIYIISSLIN